MRTVYGKLRRTKSGQARKPLTARQSWTLLSFQFLKQHVSVRTFTRQLGQMPEVPEVLEEESDIELPADDEQPAVTDSQSSHSSQSLPSQSQGASTSLGSSEAVAPRTSRSGRSATKKMDDVMLSIADHLKGSANVATHVQSLMQTLTDEKQAWFQWLAIEARKLDNDSWNAYRTDTYQLLHKYLTAQAHKVQPPQAVPHQHASLQPSSLLRPSTAPVHPASMQMPMGTSTNNQSWLLPQGAWTGAPASPWPSHSTAGLGPMGASGQGSMSNSGQGGMSSSQTAASSTQRRAGDSSSFPVLSPYLDNMGPLNTPDMPRSVSRASDLMNTVMQVGVEFDTNISSSMNS